jgi:hypothetical protein
MRLSKTLRMTSRGSPPGRRVRGTAEIELMLAIPIILAILFLSVGAMTLGLGRLDLVFAAQQAAILDATGSQSPQYGPSADLQPPDGLAAVRPELPNRMHVAILSKAVDYSAGNMKMRPVTLTNRVALLAPTWAYSAYPFPDDQTVLDTWFTTYVDESHMSITGPLGLQPAWAP